MVYGESHRHARCYVLGISHFLEVSADSDGEIKKDVIQNVKYGKDDFGLHKGVGQENKYEATVLEREYFPLAETDNTFPYQGTQKIVDHVVDHKKSGNLLNTVLELLDHEENSKGYKNLAPRPPHKSEKIKKPVLLPENHLFALRRSIPVYWILSQAPYTCSKNEASEENIHLSVIQH